MRVSPIYEGDSLIIEVTVTDQATATVKDLSGLTLEATAENRKDQDVEGTCTATDAANGVFEVSFTAGALSQGDWRVAARVTDGLEVQTVVEVHVQVKDNPLD